MIKSIRSHPLWRISLGLIGVVAFVAAVALAFGGIDLSSLSVKQLPHACGLALAIGLNLTLTGLLFWSVTLSFDAMPAVGPRRMIVLIFASSLLNYLPFRAGLFGRAAYLKTHHKLPLSQSALILAAVLVVGAIVLGVTALSVILWPTAHQAMTCLAAIGGLLVLGLGTNQIGSKLLGRPIQGGWVWFFLRIVDMLVVGGRTWLAFAMIGSPLTYWQAVAVGAGGMLVSLLGLTPNGLGLREWAIAGITLAVSPYHAAVGMAAALVDRAIEALVVVALGTPSILHLTRSSKTS